jgi:subfamily B ATP-binding cassette protein MsbA
MLQHRPSSGGTAQWPAVRLLRDHVRGQLPWLVLATVCMAFYAAATAGQAWLMEPILDRVFLERDRAMLIFVPIAVVALALLKAGTGYGQTAAMSRAGQRIVAELQRRLFDHTLRADLGHVVERGPGPLISSLIYDTQLLRAAVSSSLTTVARDLLTVVFLVGLMFYRDWQLATIALVGLPLAILPIMRVSARTRAVAAQSQAETAKLAARAEQVYRGIRQVKADNREADEAARTAAMIGNLFRLRYRATRIGGISSPVMEVIGGLAIAVVIAYGGWQVVDGTSSPGMFFSFVAALVANRRENRSWRNGWGKRMMFLPARRDQRRQRSASNRRKKQPSGPSMTRQCPRDITALSSASSASLMKPREMPLAMVKVRRLPGAGSERDAAIRSAGVSLPCLAGHSDPVVWMESQGCGRSVTPRRGSCLAHRHRGCAGNDAQRPASCALARSPDGNRPARCQRFRAAICGLAGHRRTQDAIEHRIPSPLVPAGHPDSRAGRPIRVGGVRRPRDRRFRPNARRLR